MLNPSNVSTTSIVIEAAKPFGKITEYVPCPTLKAVAPKFK